MEKSNLLEGSISKSLIKYIIPLFFSFLCQALYGLIDLVIVGQFCDSQNISAVANGSQIMTAITFFMNGISMGVAILIGHAVGAGRKEKAFDYVGGQIKILAVVCVVCLCTIIPFARQLSVLVNIPSDALIFAEQYLIACTSGVIFIAAYNGISAIFRGFGDSKNPLLFIAVATIANVFLDLLFVAGLKMNALGAGLATVIAQAISVVFALLFIKFKKLPYKLKKENFKNKSVAKILKVGLPIAVQDFLTSISFVILFAIINSLGLVASASFGVCEKIFGIFSVVAMSFMSGLSTFVAQNIGAEKYKRADKSLLIAIAISFSIAIFIFFMVFFGGEYIAMVFTRDKTVIAGARDFLRGSSYEYLCIAIFFCLLGYFNGKKKTLFVMSQSIISAFAARIPLAYVFSKMPDTNMTKMGFAISMSSIICLVLCVSYLIFTKIVEKTKEKKMLKI